MALIATRNQELFLAEQRHLHKVQLQAAAAAAHCGWVQSQQQQGTVAQQPPPPFNRSRTLEAALNITLLH